MKKSPIEAVGLTLFFFIFSVLIPGIARGGSVSLKLEMNPTGSFYAKSEQLQISQATKDAKGGFIVKDATLAIDSLKTGVDLRDKHMKEKYLESGKYPKATLSKAIGKNGKFVGMLSVHGQTKRVSGAYEMNGKDIEAVFTCRSSDFKIAKAKYLGVGVSDDVEVTVKFAVVGGRSVANDRRK